MMSTFTRLTCAIILSFSAFVHASENEKALALFDELFDAQVERSPVTQAYLGIYDNNDKWDDYSEARQEDNYRFYKKQLAKLRKIDTSKLDSTTLISYTLFEKELVDEINAFSWRFHNYPVNQMFGRHSDLPAFLINIHKIDSVKDARAYISRLNKIPTVIDDLIESMEVRKQKEIIPPKFVFPHVIRDVENLISGHPFATGDDVALLNDFKKKIAALDIAEKDKKKLIKSAEKALLKNFGPAYRNLADYLAQLEESADTRAGVWKFPQGDDFYSYMLERTTTTRLTADQIHKIGLEEVARIHNEMRTIMAKLDFEGSLSDFFQFMREDKRFYYPDTPEGRETYLTEAKMIISTMKDSLDKLFFSQPKAELIVKAVEPFRELSAGKAFYQRPAPDGSRPGIYYANLSRMENMPIYQMEALAYHEGIPGHHMQLSIAQEIEDFPKFRKFGGYTAYIEGWGLYSELLPKEYGFYSNPYSDFGRLVLELWRACRLVVDTGLHHKKWTREQAIEYLNNHTPNSHDDSVKAIERYIVMPSQATAYKIGMLKILELRTHARAQLGEDFDIREFHDLILKNGPVPLDLLEQLVNDWVAERVRQKLSQEPPEEVI